VKYHATVGGNLVQDLETGREVYEYIANFEVIRDKVSLARLGTIMTAYNQI